MFGRPTIRLVPLQGETSMSRNFGVPRQTHGAYRGPMWPLLVVTLIMIGLINVAAYLIPW